MPQFFGKIDRTKNGKVSSAYPAWYFDNQIEILEESIAKKKHALKGGFVARESEGEYRITIDREQKRLDDIIEGRPKLSDAEKDKCAKAYKHMTQEISRSMYTRSDMMRNFVDAHEENRNNTRPVIKASSDFAEMAEENGIRVTDNGMMARKDVEKLCKIIGRAIGENTNMERLRKDGNFPGMRGPGRPRG